MVEIARKVTEIFKATESMDVKQSCMYSYAIYSRFIDQASLQPLLQTILEQINSMVLASDAQDDENIVATEQAVSTLGSLIVYHRDD